MINKETLNYVDITILKFKNTDTMNEIIKIGDPTIQPENGKQQNPIVNHSFKIEELDQSTVHRILAHTSEEKFKDVVKSTRNVIWESYQSKINTLFRS